jgi:muramoyltetrapeptide carboxypeptidase
MRLVKPSKLNDGDTVGVIAPSHSVLALREKYFQGVSNIKNLGFKVKEGKTVNLQYSGYMAGTDVQRAEDINGMFADEEVKAIICAMGGAVAIRTLRYLDFDVIRAKPKIFCGMSDITTYHVALLAKTGLVGLHQTDVIFGFGTDMGSKESKYEMDLFFKVTKKAEPLGLLPTFTNWEVWRDGQAEGRLLGGSLPTLQSLLGTPYFPKLDEDIIFFWEAMMQPLDLLDQRLVQFREAGFFDRAKGMLIGKIRGEEPEPEGIKAAKVRDMTREVKGVILEITEEFDFPIIACMDFGHYTPNLPLPLGLKASMNTEGARFWINESYVK